MIFHWKLGKHKNQVSTPPIYRYIGKKINKKSDMKKIEILFDSKVFDAYTSYFIYSSNTKQGKHKSILYIDCCGG